MKNKSSAYNFSILLEGEFISASKNKKVLETELGKMLLKALSTNKNIILNHNEKITNR